MLLLADNLFLCPYPLTPNWLSLQVTTANPPGLFVAFGCSSAHRHTDEVSPALVAKSSVSGVQIQRGRSWMTSPASSRAGDLRTPAWVVNVREEISRSPAWEVCVSAANLKSLPEEDYEYRLHIRSPESLVVQTSPHLSLRAVQSAKRCKHWGGQPVLH